MSFAQSFPPSVHDFLTKRLGLLEPELLQTENGHGVAGHLYPGKPAPEGAGPTVHLASPGILEDALERVRQAGGQVLSEPFSIPAGRFAYCLDPDGNSIGIFSR